MFWLWVAPAGNSEERWSYSPHLPSPGHTHTWAHYCTPTAQTIYIVKTQQLTKSFTTITEDAGTWTVYLHINRYLILTTYVTLDHKTSQKRINNITNSFFTINKKITNFLLNLLMAFGTCTFFFCWKWISRWHNCHNSHPTQSLTPCPEQITLSLVPGHVLKLNSCTGRHLWLKQMRSVPHDVPSSTYPKSVSPSISTWPPLKHANSL